MKFSPHGKPGARDESARQIQ